MKDDVVYMRLVNGDQIAARVIENELLTIVVEYPFLIEQKEVNGNPAINLVKYLPFNTGQILMLDKTHVIAFTSVSEEFAKYYHNNVQYNEVYVQPHTDANITHINKNLELAMSKEAKAFNDNLQRFADRIPDTGPTRLH